MKFIRSAALALSGLTLTACGGQKAAEPVNPVAQCKTCHSFKKGAPGLSAPNLNGIIGKAAASQPDFKYSSAMKSSGIVWTTEKLDAYIAGPAALVPSTRMNFPGVQDAAKRKAIIDYLQNEGSK
ncbi:cytochrome c family protein [Sphingobium sp. EM0848]|uniref:c-type cytochrome n=1 Tax=Sphingobium sp. EM0848 TaxID=2743473 RepID=UPI00159C2857|nr:c-type cytochrome [Sphingobium sp. EM0848]